MVESQGVANIGLCTRCKQLTRATSDAAKSQPEAVHWYWHEYHFQSVMSKFEIVVTIMKYADCMNVAFLVIFKKSSLQFMKMCQR